MTKITMGILICTLLLSSKIIAAEESAERLKDISKAVSAQLLRMKQKKIAVVKPDTTKKAEDSTKALSKTTDASDSQKKNLVLEKADQQATKDVEKIVTEVSTNAESAETVEKKDKTLQQGEEVTKKSAKLKKDKTPQTNLQKNDLLRQQIQNIVKTK